jgi:hypothetical protein
MLKLKTHSGIYVYGKCRTQFMLPMERSVTLTGACANEIIPSINRSFVHKAKEGRHSYEIHLTSKAIYNIGTKKFTFVYRVKSNQSILPCLYS